MPYVTVTYYDPPGPQHIHIVARNAAEPNDIHFRIGTAGIILDVAEARKVIELLTDRLREIALDEKKADL